jgi:aminomethyltransferase
MEVDAQDAPTDLDVFVHRISPLKVEDRLPPPLADPRVDLRISNSTASCYEVSAGEYIQIIDVAGRQCSDFLAFDHRRLLAGEERGLDATTTRTLMGNSYPLPGLYSKFYDQDMRAMVEVVRDTVNRHDTFALACTAKYYADNGYPGHANCSDNFNGALSPYGVAPRAGWPAINFFYNTGVDKNNVLYFDEPWSRPGDYVLLRALTDLVCASSACPDDIDPANGWNPTDIHVRVYSAKNSFSKGIAHRMTADAPPQLTRETGFHSRTSALTRDYVDYRSFWLPNSYPGYGTLEEYYACREQAVIMDLSPLRKFEILGPDAEALMQATSTRNMRKLAVGQVVYTALCNEHGGIVDDGTIYRLCQNNFRFVGGDDFGGIWLRQQAEKLGLRAWVRSSTEQLHNVAVQGPNSRDILREIIWTAPTRSTLEELTWFKFTIGRIDDAHGTPVMVSRTGYSGELGYEVWCHPSDAEKVWDRIWAVGQNYGLKPLGLAALDMLRIESGLIFAGYEFDDQIDPYEAGIGFAVVLNNEEDFVGKEALKRRKENPQRVLVGLELQGNEPAAHGDCVHIDRTQVGVVTSGTRSPILEKNIALCRLAVQYSAPGTEVEVGKLDGHQKRIPATVVKFPFYDPEKKRPRS